jgi:large subunit ribosomal protein L3
MSLGILGRKVGMTQIYDETGRAVPVTVIQAGPCHVLQLRTVERDGYEAVQLGFLDKPRRRARRSQRGHVAKLDSKRSRKLSAAGVALPQRADCEPKRFIREIRGGAGDLSVGDEVHVDRFQPTLEDLPDMLRSLAEEKKVKLDQPGWRNELQKKHAGDLRKVMKSIRAVDVTGTSIGRGTAGVMKRHNFSGQRASHGVKKVHRHAGGTGCSASPSRTFKGRRMAGRYGAAKTTVRNLKVARVDSDNHLMLVYGAVPGPIGGMLVVRESNKL